MCNYEKLTRFSAHLQLDKVLNLGTLEVSTPKICIRGVTIHYLGVLIYCHCITMQCYTYIVQCNTFTPHIKASSHATYIMLHSLGVLQIPKCGTTSSGMCYNFQWNVVQLPIGMQIILLCTLTHNALSHSSNWLHIQRLSIVGEMLEQCSSTVLIFIVFCVGGSKGSTVL